MYIYHDICHQGTVYTLVSANKAAVIVKLQV